MAKRPNKIYFLMGWVERWYKHPGRRLQTKWYEGYADDPKSIGPWITYREAQTEARTKGLKAVFRRY